MYAFLFRLPFRVRLDYQGSIAFVAAGVIVPGLKPLVKSPLGLVPCALVTRRASNATRSERDSGRAAVNRALPTGFHERGPRSG